VQSRTRRLLACTFVLVLAACADVASAQRSDAPSTAAPTVPATVETTTTTVDPAAVAAWFEAVAANQRAEQARLAAEAERQRQRTTTTQRTSRSAQTGSAGGLTPAQNACAIPDYICRRESNMTTNAKNPHSTASGKYQFLDSTWNGYGGYQHASDAPEAVQDAKARELWNGGRGCSHWSAC